MTEPDSPRRVRESPDGPIDLDVEEWRRYLDEALTVAKRTAYVPHELLAHLGGHVCDATCLALYGNAYMRVPGPLPWHTRARYALRRARWRLARVGGLRLVHKDRIDQDRDDD